MSGTDNQELIQIRATAKRNGITSMVMGISGLVFAAALLRWLPDNAYLVGIFAASASIVSVLIGWFKLREPEHSVELSHQKIMYRHRHGQWQLNWDNIQRIDTPTVSKGLQQQSLGMVGIKIKDYQPLLASISPRLATNLLIEQRPLLLHSSTCSSGTCYSENMLEDDRFKFDDGTIIKGIPAMLANRMTKLRERLGFDLFIAASELDREADEFVSLLRQCQSQVLVSSDR